MIEPLQDHKLDLTVFGQEGIHNFSDLKIQYSRLQVDVLPIMPEKVICNNNIDCMWYMFKQVQIFAPILKKEFSSYELCYRVLLN